LVLHHAMSPGPIKRVGDPSKVHEQLRNVRTARQPRVVDFDTRHQFAGFATQRNLLRPGQDGAAGFRGWVGGQVVAQILGFDRSKHAAGECLANKEVLLHHEFLTPSWLANGLCTLAGLWRQVAPGHRFDDGLQKGNPAHPIGMSTCPVEGKRASPVVADEDDIGEVEGVEPGVQVSGVVGKLIRDVGLARASRLEAILEAAVASGAAPQHALRTSSLPPNLITGEASSIQFMDADSPRSLPVGELTDPLLATILGYGLHDQAEARSEPVS
jgi:hypothetical protein